MNQSEGFLSKCDADQEAHADDSIETEVSSQRIRGSIRWSETYAQRAATGAPNLSSQRPLAGRSTPLKTKCWLSRCSLSLSLVPHRLASRS